MTNLDNYRVGKEHDGRRKLTDADRLLIKELYNTGKGIREIARTFEGICSRRMIQFVLFPDRLETVKKRAIEVKRWQPYNVKEVHTPAMRKHRAKKRELLKQNTVLPISKH